VFLTKDSQGNIVQVAGAWSFADDKVYLKDSNGDDFMILAIKRGRDQLIAVADFVNGGFGLATESVPTNSKDYTGYRYLKFIQNVGANQNEICLGTAKVSKVDDNHVKISEKDSKCFMVYINSNVNAVFFEEVPVEQPVTYQATINPEIELAGNYVPMNSVALSTGVVNAATIIDGDNGLFAQIGVRNSKEVAILGSNRVIH
jgi:hypothetical protein